MRHQGYVPLQRPPEDHSFLLIYITCRGELVETGSEVRKTRGCVVRRRWAKPEMGLGVLVSSSRPHPHPHQGRPDIRGLCSFFSTGNSGGHLVSSFSTRLQCHPFKDMVTIWSESVQTLVFSELCKVLSCLFLWPGLTG